MIVKYCKKRCIDEDGTTFGIGNLYIVISFFFLKEDIKIRILKNGNQYPVVAKLKYFKVIDSNLHTSLELTEFGDGCYCIEPKEFAGDFWDDFHDGGNKEVEEKFRQEIKKLYEFHGWKFNPKHFQYS